jgi:hypothetical protein
MAVIKVGVKDRLATVAAIHHMVQGQCQDAPGQGGSCRKNWTSGTGRRRICET